MNHHQNWPLVPKQNRASDSKKYKWWLWSRQPKMSSSATDDHYAIKSLTESLNMGLKRQHSERRNMVKKVLKVEITTDKGGKSHECGRLLDQKAIDVQFKGNNKITGLLYLLSGSLELLMGHWSYFYVLNGDKWFSSALWYPALLIQGWFFLSFTSLCSLNINTITWVGRIPAPLENWKCWEEILFRCQFLHELSEYVLTVYVWW